MNEQTYNLTEEEIASAVAYALSELADNIPTDLATVEVNLHGEVTEFLERSELAEWLDGATAKDDATHAFREAIGKLDPDGE